MKLDFEKAVDQQTNPVAERLRVFWGSHTQIWSNFGSTAIIYILQDKNVHNPALLKQYVPQ